MKISFLLNNKNVSIDTNPEKRLIDVIREDFKLIMSKGSCYSGGCGCCTVILNGITVPSCQIPVFAVRNKSVTTIEGFINTEKYLDIINAFSEWNCIPCPFCFAGKILAVDLLLESRNSPSTDQIMALLSDHPCSCISVSQFINGVKKAYVNREIREELSK